MAQVRQCDRARGSIDSFVRVPLVMSINPSA
jgi:hypothetical protein